MNKLEISLLSWLEASQEAFRIRKLVFIDEQGVPEELELDECDPQAIHALATIGERTVGTARLVALDTHQAQIGRMAVLKEYRNQGIGTELLKKLIEKAQMRNILQLSLHAQVSAIPFYEKLGFVAQGPIYDEAGIPHRNMMLILPNKVI